MKWQSCLQKIETIPFVHKYNYYLKILQVFETLMQLTTQNNESVSYDKTQIEKNKLKEEELKINDLKICVIYSIYEICVIYSNTKPFI